MLTNYTVFGTLDGTTEVIDRCVTSMAAINLVKECEETYPDEWEFSWTKGNFWGVNPKKFQQ
jgi:hypothetical protein